jgi:hypothetical protein
VRKSVQALEKKGVEKCTLLKKTAKERRNEGYDATGGADRVPEGLRGDEIERGYDRGLSDVTILNDSRLRKT